MTPLLVETQWVKCKSRFKVEEKVRMEGVL